MLDHKLDNHGFDIVFFMTQTVINQSLIEIGRPMACFDGMHRVSYPTFILSDFGFLFADSF
jgi:hypothetical protein